MLKHGYFVTYTVKKIIEKGDGGVVPQKNISYDLYTTIGFLLLKSI